MKEQRIWFVGLGQMGQPMALNLLKAGVDLCVYDLNEERVAPFIALGASQAFRLQDVGEPGGIVLTMVPDDAALLAVTEGAGGLVKRLGMGGIHLSLSTISPHVSEHLAQQYRHTGGYYLSATVLGRPDVAANAALSIFLSGASCAKQRVMPLLEVLGKRMYDLGEDVKAANVVKLGANFLILAALEAMGEAASFVEYAGVDRELFMRMMVESPLFAGAVYEGYGKMIGSQDYSDARFPVRMGLKDAHLVLQAAERSGVSLPLAQIAHDHLLAAQVQGREREDWAVLAEFVREIAVPV